MPIEGSRGGAGARRQRAGRNDEGISGEESGVEAPAGKRRRVVEAAGETARERAREYRMTTARMPTAALTAKWERGKNRELNKAQVGKLQEIFERGGLNRTAGDHRIRVLCRREQVSRMLEHIRSAGRQGEAAKTPDFRDWLAVNDGVAAEVMDGQHRIKALEAYVEKAKGGPEELWWECEFYDKEKLPWELNLKLRMNRTDAVMEDSHGQIWTQLVAAYAHDETLSLGTAAEVEQRVMEALQLSGETKIPVRRLVTIWRNARWRQMATGWCGLPIGRETFRISTWEWMISCRMDDYWFSGFHHVLRAINSMPEPAHEGITAADWKRMTAELPGGRTEETVHELFYPTGRARAAGAAGSVAPASRDTTRRRAGFLAQLDDAAYREVYEDVASRPGLRFRDLRRVTGLSQEDGRVPFRVINHLVSWVIPEPTVTHNRRSNEKPPLRRDLARALGHCDEEFVQATERKLGGGVLYAKEQPPDEEASILLQQEVVDFALDNLAELRGAEHRHYLDETLQETGAPDYAKRFSTPAWAGVLSIARRYFGDNLPREWRAPHTQPSPPSPPRARPRDRRAADILESFQASVLRAPGLAGDMTLVMSDVFQSALVRWYSQGPGREMASPRPEEEALRGERANQAEEPDRGSREAEEANGCGGIDEAAPETTPPGRVPSHDYGGRTARRLGALRGKPGSNSKKKPGWMKGPRAVG